MPRAMQFFQLTRLSASLLTGVVLAWSGLSVAEIGIYELLMYLVTTASFFWLNGLLQGLPAVYSQSDGEGKEYLVFQSFIIFSLIAFTLSFMLWAGEQWLAPALIGRSDIPFLPIFALYLAFHLPAFPVEFYYLLRNRSYSLAGWGIVQFVFQLGALGIPLWRGSDLGVALSWLTVAAALRWLWALGLALRWGRAGWKWPLARRYLHFSTPLMLNSVLANMILLFDSWLVGWYYTDPALFAVFRYGSREFPLSLALATALGVAMIPRIAADGPAGLEELKSRSRRLFHLVFPLTIALVFLTPWLFPLAFTSAFNASIPLFQLYLLLTASRLLLPNSVVLAYGKPQAIFYTGLGELLIKMGGGFVLIGWWGLEGVAWSAIIAYFFEKIALIWWLERRAGIKTIQWLDVKVYGRYVLALFVAYGAAVYFSNAFFPA